MFQKRDNISLINQNLIMSKQSNSTPTASDLKRRVEELERDLEASNQRRKMADAELREYLRCALAGHEREIQCKDKDIQCVESEKEQLTVQNASLRKDVQALDGSIKSLREELKSLKESSRVLKESKEEEIRMMKERLKERESLHKAELEKAKSLGQDVASKKEYEQLKAENEMLRQANGNVLAQYHTLYESNQCMLRDYGPLKVSYEQLYNGHDALLFEYANLQEKCKSLEDAAKKNKDNCNVRLQSLEMTLKTKEKEIQRMKDAVDTVANETKDELLSRIKSLEQEVARRDEDCGKLQTKNGDLVSQMQVKCKDLEGKSKQLQDVKAVMSLVQERNESLEKILKSKEEKIKLVKQVLQKRAAEEIKVFGSLEHLLSENDEPTSKRRRFS